MKKWLEKHCNRAKVDQKSFRWRSRRGISTLGFSDGSNEYRLQGWIGHPGWIGLYGESDSAGLRAILTRCPVSLQGSRFTPVDGNALWISLRRPLLIPFVSRIQGGRSFGFVEKEGVCKGKIARKYRWDFTDVKPHLICPTCPSVGYLAHRSVQGQLRLKEPPEV